MATATIMPETNRTLLAAVAILGYALAIGYTDNYVQVIAREAGLWQFHATRTVMAFAIVALVAVPLGLRLRPRKPGAVALRSAIHGVAMFIYFGCLAFLPVATVAAGLFTAPIFTLLISRFAFGIPIGPFRVAGVVLGFAGAILVLGPGQGGAIGLATVLPIAAGALYALGNIATRQWCEGESAETLLLGFFAMLGLLGLVGCAVLALWQPAVPEGADGFILRGLVWPSPDFLFWTFVQAAGSLIGVGLMIKAYQIAEASRVAIFEYVILPASAFWAFVLWGDVLDLRAVAGIGLIFAAGLIIALRGR
ncbi:DMT family transporter [Defluviimonas salinarum]|uniref:DMT family transporter n=1 Tax=Defluviimonas salinarum TaxID=2992147 RepID=A0ABT3J8T2_9RHOB|nr:DMT family transporter [Defluviimonas salinarum]MCW3784098.1 DMT family transporter [Defluviimonas salinarum]